MGYMCLFQFWFPQGICLAVVLLGPMVVLRRKQWYPTPVLLPGKSQGWRSLVVCSPWARKELDMTERLHCHFSLSCIGEGNGKPLQCSCLENPRDGGAWWAAIYGVAQSQTRLKRLSSSSCSMVVLSLVFKGISIPSSIEAVSIHIPTNSARAFPFLHILSSFYCL